MKKFVIFAVAVGLATSPAYARDRKDTSKTATPVVAASAPVEDKAKREETQKKIEEKKKELNGTQWNVALTSGGKSEGEDVLTFQNAQVSSKIFGNKGYPSTNYTISFSEGSDMATWETMQTNPKGGVVFIRGEWKEGVMRGVISQQLEEGKSKDYNFTSANKASIPTTTEPKQSKQKESTTPTKEGSEDKIVKKAIDKEVNI